MVRVKPNSDTEKKKITQFSKENHSFYTVYEVQPLSVFTILKERSIFVAETLTQSILFLEKRKGKNTSGHSMMLCWKLIDK